MESVAIWLKFNAAESFIPSREDLAKHYGDHLTPEQIDRLIEAARDDARLLVERDGGLKGARGEAARILLYLFDRDAAVALLRSG